MSLIIHLFIFALLGVFDDKHTDVKKKFYVDVNTTKGCSLTEMKLGKTTAF